MGSVLIPKGAIQCVYINSLESVGTRQAMWQPSEVIYLNTHCFNHGSSIEYSCQ